MLFVFAASSKMSWNLQRMTLNTIKHFIIYIYLFIYSEQ